MANLLERRIAPTVAGLQGGLAVAILQWGNPGPVPMHFNLAGEVDRYGSRQEAAILVGAMALLTLLGPMLLRTLSRRRGEDADDFREANVILLGVTTLVCTLLACLAFGLITPDRGLLGAMSAISAILAVVGAYLGKVGPNAMVGVRTPWTFASRLAWDKANRLAGRLFFWAGLIGFFVAPFAPQPVGLQAFTVVVLAITALSVFESWRVWRSDPDRAGAL